LKIRLSAPTSKTITLTLLSITVFGALGSAFYLVPKYLREQQQIRDAARDCVNYRDFLITSDAWAKEGDTDQAQGVYALAIDNFKKGKCTKVH